MPEARLNRTNTSIGFMKNGIVANNTYMLLQLLSTFLGRKNNITLSYSSKEIPEYGYGPKHPMKLFNDELWNTLTIFVYNTLSEKGLITPTKDAHVKAHIPNSIRNMLALQSEPSLLSQLNTTVSSLLGFRGAPSSKSEIEGTTAEVLEYIADWLKYSSTVEEKNFKTWCRAVNKNTQFIELMNDNTTNTDRENLLLLQNVGSSNSQPKSITSHDCPYSMKAGKVPGQVNLCSGHWDYCVQGSLFDGETLIAQAARWIYDSGHDYHHHGDLWTSHGLELCYPVSKLLSDVCNNIPKRGDFLQNCPIGTSASYEGTSYAGNVILFKVGEEATTCLKLQNNLAVAFNNCLNDQSSWNGYRDIIVNYVLPIYGGIGLFIAVSCFCLFQYKTNDESRPLLGDNDGFWTKTATNAGVALAVGACWPLCSSACAR